MSILIIIASLAVLILLHELGHFIFAKKYGVRVDEFGIGIPPRVYGKKIGETIYSINLIPLGGFVKLHGEDRQIDDERSFSSKPLYQRALILFAGVGAFFVIAFLIFSLQSVVGVRTVVDDDVDAFENPEIFITEIMSDSPAENAGMEPGDVLWKIEGAEIDKIKEAQSLIEERKGKKTEIELRRGDNVISLSLVPREDYPEGEGSLGIAMARTVKKTYPLYMAPLQGVIETGRTTYMYVSGIYTLAASSIKGEPLPPGMELAGPVGIVDIGAGAAQRGLADYLQFVGAITIALAVLNIMPIPALDGGRLLFLGIEKIKGKPLPEKVEYGLNAVFFLLLLGLMIVITFRDLGL